MNTERLHAVANALRQELHDRGIVEKLENLVGNLQAVSSQSIASTQQKLANGLNSFYESVTDTPSDSFSPAWRQILKELGGAKLFGKVLKRRVEKTISENQMTPAVAFEQLGLVLEELQSFMGGLDSVLSGFRQFNIGADQLAPGEAEITLLIPRKEVNNELRGFVDELDELEFILNTFAQVSTGKKEELKIRSVSSSDLMMYLLASPRFAACVAKAIDFVVGLYKKLLEIKKIRLEIEKLDMPDISEQVKQRANQVMTEGIEKVSVEIVTEFYVGNNGERKNELTNAVRISLNRIANRIDRGFNIEVRIAPPTETELEATEETKKAVAVIQAAAPNMQYLKLEGPPILALPEKLEESEQASGHKAPPKRRIRPQE